MSRCQLIASTLCAVAKNGAVSSKSAVRRMSGLVPDIQAILGDIRTRKVNGQNYPHNYFRTKVRFVNCNVLSRHVQAMAHDLIPSKGPRFMSTDSNDPLSNLVYILSPTDSDGLTLQAKRIKSLYYHVRHRQQLKELTPAHFSTLIAVFGLVSVSSAIKRRANGTPITRSNEAHEGDIDWVVDSNDLKIVGLLDEPAKDKDHWGFVHIVAEDKESVGYKLNETDHYWLMRSAVESMEVLMHDQTHNHKRLRYCHNRAREHYISFGRASHESQYMTKFQAHGHEFYLLTLLSLPPTVGNGRLLSEVAFHSAHILRKHRYLHPKLVQALWACLSRETEFSESGFAVLLKELRRKAIRELKSLNAHTTPYHDVSNPGPQGLQAPTQADSKLNPHNAHVLRLLFVEALFSKRIGAHQITSSFLSPLSEQDAITITSWVRWQVDAALYASVSQSRSSSDPVVEKERDRKSWQNLRLLALSHRSAESGLQGMEVLRPSGQGLSSASVTDPSTCTDSENRSEGRSPIDFSSNPSPSLHVTTTANPVLSSPAHGWTLVCALAALSSVPSRSPNAFVTLTFPLLSLFKALLAQPPSTSPSLPLSVTLCLLGTFIRLASAGVVADDANSNASDVNWLCDQVGRVVERVVDDLLYSGEGESYDSKGLLEIAVGWMTLRVLSRGGHDIGSISKGGFQPFKTFANFGSHIDDSVDGWQDVWSSLRVVGFESLLVSSPSTISKSWKGDFASSFVVTLARYDVALAAQLLDTSTLNPDTDGSISALAHIIVARGLAQNSHWDSVLACFELSPDSLSQTEDPLLLAKLKWGVFSQLVRHLASLDKVSLHVSDKALIKRSTAVLKGLVRDGGNSETRIFTPGIERLLLLSFNAGATRDAVRVLTGVVMAEGNGPPLISFSRRFVSTFLTLLIKTKCYGHLRSLAVAVGRSNLRQVDNGEATPTETPTLATLLLENPTILYLANVVSTQLRAQPPDTQTPSAAFLPLSAIMFAAYDWPQLRHVLRPSPNMWQLEHKVLSLKISHLLNRSKQLPVTSPRTSEVIDNDTAERLVFLLARAGRERTALRLVKEGKMNADGKLTTKMGNIILSAYIGFFRQSVMLSGSRVSQTLAKGSPKRSRIRLCTLAQLSKFLRVLIRDHGFVPDRVTFNTTIRAFLERDSARYVRRNYLRQRGKASESTGREISLRAMFDRLVATGYPSGSNVRTVFGTAVHPNATATPLQVAGVTISSPILFERHVQPLYHMFVRAFRRRGDLAAADKVRDLLKALRRDRRRKSGE